MPANQNDCCKMETGALAYGIINIIISTLVTLAGLVILAFIHIINLNSYERTYVSIAILLSTMLPALLSLLFSIVLICGVTQKKPGLVLSYFIFGIISLPVALAGCIYLICKKPDDILTLRVIGGAYLGVYFIFSMPFIIVVYKTYRKLQSGGVYDHCNKQQNHRQPPL